MRRDDTLDDLEEKMVLACNLAFDTWQQNREQQPYPPQILVKLMRDTHMSLSSTLKRLVENEEGLSPEQLLLRLTEARSTLLKKMERQHVMSASVQRTQAIPPQSKLQ